MGIELAKAFISVRADTSGVVPDINAAKPQVQSSLAGLAGSINGVMSTLTGVAGALFARKALNLAGEAEQMQIAFETMLGSAEEAKDIFGRLTEFAALTPFEMPEITATARGLIQFGERGDDLMETLEMLGNAASGTSTQFQMVGLIFNQIRGVGKLLTQDFRQLSTRGIISLQDIAKYYKVSTAEAQNMLSTGRVSFADFKKIMAGLSAEGGRFYGMMKRQSTSYKGLLSTLSDSINLVIRSIGEGLLPVVKPVIVAMIEWTDAVRSWVGEHKQLVGLVFGSIVALGAIKPVLTVLGFALKTFFTSVGAGIKSLFSWGTVWGLIIAGAVTFIRWVSKIKSVQDAWARATEKFAQAWANVKVAVERLVRMFVDWFSRVLVSLGLTDRALFEIRDTGAFVVETLLDLFSDLFLKMSRWLRVASEEWGTFWAFILTGAMRTISQIRDSAARAGGETIRTLVPGGELLPKAPGGPSTETRMLDIAMTVLRSKVKAAYGRVVEDEIMTAANAAAAMIRQAMGFGAGIEAVPDVKGAEDAGAVMANVFKNQAFVGFPELGRKVQEMLLKQATTSPEERQLQNIAGIAEAQRQLQQQMAGSLAQIAGQPAGLG